MKGRSRGSEVYLVGQIGLRSIGDLDKNWFWLVQWSLGEGPGRYRQVEPSEIYFSWGNQ
jgi:hypothetical protein